MSEKRTVTINDLRKNLAKAVSQNSDAASWPVFLVANDIKHSIRITVLHGAAYITPVYDYGMGFTVDIKELPDERVI